MMLRGGCGDADAWSRSRNEPALHSTESRINIIGHRKGYRRNMQTFYPDGITEALDTGQGGGRGHHVAIPVDTDDPQIKVVGNTRLYDGKAKNDMERIFAIDGIVGALRSSDYKDPQKVAIPVLTPDRANKRQNGRRFKEDGDPSFTLTGQDRHGVAIGIPLTDEDMEALENAEDRPGIFVQLTEDCIVYCVWYEPYECYIAIRKLTPKECFRLQGWDDEYFDRAQMVNSDSQLYKQAGNGVTVSVIKAIAERMNLNEREDKNVL